MVRISKKKFIVLLVASILCFIGCFSGCAKQITEVDFYEFAKENLATEFYEMCDELVYITEDSDEKGLIVNSESGIAEYYYNLKTDFIWRTATMVKVCYYSEFAYDAITKTMMDTWGLRKIAEEYEINGIKSTIYYVGNIEHQYGENKDFALVALSDEKDSICFLWFYDQDYDVLISTHTFDDFYKSEFEWFEKK